MTLMAQGGGMHVAEVLLIIGVLMLAYCLIRAMEDGIKAVTRLIADRLYKRRRRARENKMRKRLGLRLI